MTTPEDSHKNMALDSFLLHYRNLRAFLCPSLQGVRPRADDVVGSDYLGNAEAGNVADAQKLADDKDRLDQMLAHLSYKRRKEYIATGKTGWPVGKMAARNPAKGLRGRNPGWDSG